MADVYTIFPIAKKLIPNGSIDLLSDTIKVALLYGYTYDPSHDYWNDTSSQYDAVDYIKLAQKYDQ